LIRGRLTVTRFREIEVESRTPGSEANGLLGRLSKVLTAAGATDAEPLPKLRRALGEEIDAAPEVAVEEPESGQSMGRTLQQALARSVLRLQTHDPGVRLGEDPEDVHQARVATRRLRSDLRTFRGLLDEAWTNGLRDELKWLGGLLGEVRDADVLADRLRTKADRIGPGSAEALLRRLATSRTASRRALLQAMRGTRYLALLDRLVAAPNGGDLPLSADGAQPADRGLPALVRPSWQNARRAARSMDDPPTDQQLHQLRIRTKRVRYAAEAAAPVLGKRAERFAKAAAGLQDVLGEHQDAVVAGQWLRRAAVRSTPADAFVAGRLAEMERAAAVAARESWPDAWKEVRRRWPSAWS
jgi:CHAD domain-containing protein